MIVFPNCKINLGLRILGKRTDGYHDLETVFYPLPLYDALEVISDDALCMTKGRITEAHNDQSNSGILFSSSGFFINGDTDNNLCIKACNLLKKDFPQLLPVQIHLHKGIPVGAGLGGGSADAAFILKLLNEKFHLGLSTDRLIDYSLQVGSDCPFFIINKPCIATGKGEVLEQLTVNLSDYKFLIVNPLIHVSTADAFRAITPAIPASSLKKIIRQPLETWKYELINDFERTVFNQHPEIENIKTKLYHGGAIYASMSGSGSTVFGVFEKNNSAEFNFPPDYFIKELKTV